ncbi:MAG: hypothetical protein ACUVR0_06960 [Candidatus Aminicenantales bacterium]
MKYLLFTYPNCEKCAAFKAKLKEMPLEGTEIDLVRKEGKIRLREFLAHIRRDEKGAIILPVFLVLDENKVEASLTTPEELETWWRSKV